MKLQQVAEHLKARGFQAYVFATGAEAADWLCKQLAGKTVGIGGSLSVQQLGLHTRLAENNTVYWHWLPEQVEQHGGMNAVRDLAATAEVYLTSANALSAQGQIINIDGAGNRIASTAYGHKQVYFLVGANKVAADFDAAMHRARNVAAPLNARRLGRQTPCAVGELKCHDCNSPQRICNGFLTLERPMSGTETFVLLVEEELGA